MKKEWKVDECFICNRTVLTQYKMCADCHADDVETCKYCGKVFRYEGNGSASCALNRHINDTHHPTCQDCGCDECTCEPPPTEEDIARWGGVIEENDDMTIYANGVAVTKRVLNVRVV